MEGERMGNVKINDEDNVGQMENEEEDEDDNGNLDLNLMQNSEMNEEDSAAPVKIKT